MGINFASLQTRGMKLVLIDISIAGKIQGAFLYRVCNGEQDNPRDDLLVDRIQACFDSCFSNSPWARKRLYIRIQPD